MRTLVSIESQFLLYDNTFILRLEVEISTHFIVNRLIWVVFDLKQVVGQFRTISLKRNKSDGSNMSNRVKSPLESSFNSYNPLYLIF